MKRNYVKKNTFEGEHNYFFFNAKFNMKFNFLITRVMLILFHNQIPFHSGVLAATILVCGSD